MSKIWIFQSKRYLKSLELIEIQKILNYFFYSWTSHKHIIQSKLEIIENRFFKISATKKDKCVINGCAIDKMIKVIKNIDDMYKLDLLNRMLVSYKRNNFIFTIHFFELKEKIQNHFFNENDLIYDISVMTEKEFNTKFIQPIKDSWAKIYL